MKLETFSDITENDKNYSVQRMNDGEIQIAEICDTRLNNLDFVVMYFKFNSNLITEVEKRIAEYRKNDGTCIIGCINSLEEVIDFTNDAEYSAFKNLTSLFDIYLDAATDFDFENLIDFCISTEDSVVHIDPYDFKSKPGTEVFVVTEQSQSIDKLIDNLKITSQKLLGPNSIKKFPKIVVSLMTNGRNLLLSEVKDIIDSMADYLTDDAQCMLNSCECMESLKENEVKVAVIFFENRTIPVS